MPSQRLKKIGLFLFLMGFAVIAQAHKVNVFAYAEGDQVYVEGYFSDGTKAKNSDVTVADASGRRLLQGKTNEQGDFTFPITERQALQITLNAGQGHQAIYDIPVDEVAGQNAASSPLPADADDPPPNAGSASEADDGASVSEAMIRKAVAQGVLPLARQISELKERRGLSDIVGGIGLIVGILGIFAYFRARQELRRLKEGRAAQQ
jgi:nickel transport protein